jgi:hypothetical protein
MQFAHDLAQYRGVSFMNGASDFRDEFRANFATFIAHRDTVEDRGIGGSGDVHIVGHAAPHRFDRITELV